ncbi:hypothetical protein L6E12_27070 [Actinokineospora sp. PR83]|uniref:hypothetical protein n=1 Tax=Actinokineospora sp. PR83 TaxID=2884908 RepID=UPI001F218AC6|nr:hypothetical protein [Actinokineospora sp. PR83]MCG8919443.1 hypothetical protein [Actinokineospora sp. PR83]
MNWAQAPEAVPFYASGTFWTIIGIVVAVLLGGAGGWVAWRSANPKRQLAVWVDFDAPLLTTRADGIQVTFKGAPLMHPHIVRVKVSARGRKDIVPGDFVGPIRIDLDTPILELVRNESTTKRENLPRPVVSIDGSALIIEPAIIPGDQRIHLDVLLDAYPVLSVTAPLANVKVTTDPSPPNRRIKDAITLFVPIASLAGLVVYSSLQGSGESAQELTWSPLFVVTAAGALVYSIYSSLDRRK